MNKAQIRRNDAMKDALQRSGVGVPGSAASALIEELIGPNAALLGAKGKKRPSRKSTDPKEREEAAARSERERHTKSLAPIAAALHCEGFGEFAAYGVLYYAKKRLWGDDWGECVEKQRSALSEQFRTLTIEQRKTAGMFIHQQAAASFEAGLRIGLMASLVSNKKFH